MRVEEDAQVHSPTALSDNPPPSNTFGSISSPFSFAHTYPPTAAAAPVIQPNSLTSYSLSAPIPDVSQPNTQAMTPVLGNGHLKRLNGALLEDEPVPRVRLIQQLDLPSRKQQDSMAIILKKLEMMETKVSRHLLPFR